MGFCQDFQYDVFVSYAHLNNQSLGLHEILKKPEIWRDDGGLDGKVIDSGIGAALESSAVFLAIVSNAFLKSTYCCPVELSAFLKSKFPVKVREYSRVVVAAYDALADVPASTWPDPLNQVQAVEFCATPGLPYTRPELSDPAQPYWQKLNELARKIHAVLLEVKKGLSGEQVSTLTLPGATPAKPAAAWRSRWLKPNVVIMHGMPEAPKAKTLAKELAHKCDTLLLPNDAPPDRQRRYLQTADGLILLFDCSDTNWAVDQAMTSLETAAQQGRPKRLGIATASPDDFPLHSDFVVPIDAVSGADAFIQSLQENST